MNLSDVRRCLFFIQLTHRSETREHPIYTTDAVIRVRSFFTVITGSFVRVKRYNRTIYFRIHAAHKLKKNSECQKQYHKL